MEKILLFSQPLFYLSPAPQADPHAAGFGSGSPAPHAEPHASPVAGVSSLAHR